ncbi:IS66 family transposase, partial [Frankia sp. Cas4]|uniref:IS66 family transposase n=1 Tax=Frankia sp. Cas4 TaxID=3073927 RepID=UPI002AD404CB
MPATPVLDDVADVAYWRERAERAEAQLTDTQSRLTETSQRTTELAEQVAVLRRILFGRSSEKTRPAPDRQETAHPDGQDERDSASPGDAPARRGQRRGRSGHGRRDYSQLETREEIHDVPAAERTCAGCGAAFVPLGTEDSEQIDWQVTITRIVHRRLRYRRRCTCPGSRTVIAPVPGKPIAKGRFTPAFLARLLYEKYVLGLGLHRIARALATGGFAVAEGTIAGALQATADLLAPLEQAIIARKATAVQVHADETGWQVFEHREGTDSTRWWLWVFVTEDTMVFTMDPTRSAAVLYRHVGIERTATALPEGRRLVVSWRLLHRLSVPRPGRRRRSAVVLGAHPP